MLAGLGADPGQAAVQVDQLLEGDLRGRPSHGMQRLPTLAQRIETGVLDPCAEPLIESSGSGLVRVDGRFGFGPPAALAALDVVVARAREGGAATAAIRATGHLGMLAPYVERLAEAGLVGLAFSTSEALVHPTGGREAMLGTNPIAIGAPAEPDPFVLDMSTAAISAGEVIVHADRGATLPPGCAVDAEGRPTTEPEAALAGALSPFGGAKGYGLGLGIELLVAALTDTELGTRVHGTLDVDRRSTKGDVLIAIDPRPLRGGSVERLSAYLAELRASPAAPGAAGVLIPGDRMRAERARRLREGIPYPAKTWERLLALERGEVADAGE